MSDTLTQLQQHIPHAFLYGLDERQLLVAEAAIEHFPPARLQPAAAKAFQALQQAAQQAGVQVNIASGYRSFSAQQGIWQRKFHAESRQHLSISERIADILRWSALPGTSRHHWGSDFDLFDQSALARSALRLEPWEYEQGGPCHALFLWLEQHAANFGFYRPYASDQGGVAPEPWHWSYAPLAAEYLELFNLEDLRHILQQVELAGFEQINPQLASYVENYVHNVAAAKPDLQPR